MKILRNEEYESLIKASIAGKEVVCDTKNKYDYDKEIEAIKKKHTEEISKLEREAKHKEEDHKREIDNLNSSIEMTVRDRLADKNDEINKLTIENNNNKKEVEILTKAFENLGFDVKDMKEILNKLVDGIVSKNTINLLK